MRVMAIDYGDAHIGIAVSDQTGMICGDAWTLDEYDAGRAAEKISQEIKDRSVDKLIVGLPKNMDGSVGPRAEICQEFAKLLGDISGLEPIMWDERRTTVDAHRILFEAGKNGKKRKKVVDAVAASLILEGFLGTL